MGRVFILKPSDKRYGGILLMMSHINSYTKKLNNQSAHRLFSFLYGDSVLPSLGIQDIPANDTNLTPRLLKK